MTLQEGLIITGTVLLGYGLLAVAFGPIGALYMIAMIGGFWLLFIGFGIIMDMISMKADESLQRSKMKRQTEMTIDSLYHARDYKDKVEDKRIRGESLDADYRII